MNKIAQSLRIPSSDGPSITECHEAANEIERLENLLATLDFYRDAYEKHLARGEALEKDNTRLYEQEALHTESYGIVCAERDRAVKALSEAVNELERVKRNSAVTMDELGEMREERDSIAGPARELLFLYDWRFELAERERKATWGTDDPTLKADLRRYGERKKAGWIALRAALAKEPLQGSPDSPTGRDTDFKPPSSAGSNPAPGIK